MSDDYTKEEFERGVDEIRRCENRVWNIDPDESTPELFAELQKATLNATKRLVEAMRAGRELSDATGTLKELCMSYAKDKGRLQAEKEDLLEYLIEFHKWVEDGCRDDQRPSCPDWIGD